MTGHLLPVLLRLDCLLCANESDEIGSFEFELIRVTVGRVYDFGLGFPDSLVSSYHINLPNTLHVRSTIHVHVGTYIISVLHGE